MTTATDTESALLATILANTEDDVVRLAYADYLDERAGGYDPRAEFIRVGCELAKRTCEVPGYCSDGSGKCSSCCEIDALCRRERELMDWFCKEDLAVEFGLSPHETLYPIEGGLIAVAPQIELRFSRGFVSHVTASYEALFGGECRRCGPPRAYPPYQWTCPDCSGTGRTPGIAADLFRAQPVQTVTFPNIRPSIETYTNVNYHYWRSQDVPEPLRTEEVCKLHTSEESALLAASAAAVRLGRQRAGV